MSGAGEAGYEAGLNSHLRYARNPHERGSDAHQIWSDAYMDGVRERRRIDVEWTRKMRERGDALRAGAKVAFTLIPNAERAIRATAASDSTDGIEVASPSAPRLYSYKVVHGPKDKAFAYAAHVFASDSCTPMYEHMLWRLFGADERPDGTVTLWFCKSHYAGD